MISSIEITRFRGIREGKLEDLSPLTILVGPNGCGKSTVLDALLIGASPEPGHAIGQAVVRHQGVRHGPRWLLWRAQEKGKAVLETKTTAGSRRKHTITLMNSARIQCRIEIVSGDSRIVSADVQFGSPTEYTILSGAAAPLPDIPDVRIVEELADSIQTPLHELLTNCIEQGRRPEVRQIIADLVPGVNDVLILTEDSSPLVYLEYADHAIPAALEGDGIHWLLRTSLELFARSEGVVLLEEPEVHQHPGAMRQTVRAILSAVRRGIQVVLSTHSLEFIDILLAESSEEDLEKLSAFRLQLEQGALKSCRLPGPEVAFSRNEIGNDLR